MMRILLLAPQPFFVQRGTPIAVRLVLETLSDAGHDVDAIVFPGGEDVAIDRVRFIRVPRLPLVGEVPPGFSVKKVLYDGLMLPMAAFRLARQRYDLVLAVEEAAFLALALKPIFGVPYIYDVDSSIPEQLDDKYRLPGWIKRGLLAAEGFVARRSIGSITCCRALETLVRRYAPELPVQTIEDVPLVDGAPVADGVRPEDCRFEAPVVMYVGNLEPYQGVALLIDGFAVAIREGSNGQLVIIGGSPRHVEEARARASRLGLDARVSLLGPRPTSELGRYLAAADIVVSPRTQGRNTPLNVVS